MTLRHLVVLLLLANLAFWSWSEGWLREIGLAPETAAEPDRLARQVLPQSLSIGPAPRPVPGRGEQGSAPVAVATPAAQTPPVSPAPAPAPVAGSTACLQAGPFDAPQADALRSAAASWPPGSWRLEGSQLPGRWMVYLGPLADADAVAGKRGELRELGVGVDRPGAALEPGLSLGRFATRESADRALVEQERKGVRGVRVVQERQDTPVHILRLPRVDAELRARLGELPLAGRELRPCD
ncbi:MAG TPA: SPOR domain-containing protein [Ottowia sp.]|uniref:SPOR domain-containing protein n=1 Tax=Ottowia sp. TaxID=1898956 RepID=UPI002CD00699|nr:SPOR domain-containing protein [Ottowia sp.]HMN21663.1 SPOR domain-containing protein [Ottowia sp.]